MLLRCAQRNEHIHQCEAVDLFNVDPHNWLTTSQSVSDLITLPLRFVIELRPTSFYGFTEDTQNIETGKALAYILIYSLDLFCLTKGLIATLIRARTTHLTSSATTYSVRMLDRMQAKSQVTRSSLHGRMMRSARPFLHIDGSLLCNPITATDRPC